MYNLCVSKDFLSSGITLSLNNQIRMSPSCVTMGLELGLGFMKCFSLLVIISVPNAAKMLPRAVPAT